MFRTLQKDDTIRLAPRAIAELEPVLTWKYGCPNCALCQRVVVRKSAAVTCDFCNVHIHKHCWTKLAAGCEADEITCPGSALSGCNGMFSKSDVAERFS
ncbi:hypothetical protein ANCCAN_24465 [Ancylostoma caninum]|uniref:Phorbol-ester/DAG-type domain-containing protein n=1 Tax=Ancylostoma caninum TaxID=29170 RepID=A0A368FFW9_ANCCA|nr:hypothetical protein ANCCAN_24465 [Ancylostoma caninum]